LSKVVIVGNGVGKESILKQLKDIDCKDIKIASSIEELNELLEEANKVPSLEECIQEINKSNKQAIFDSPAQTCKKNFKRKKFFS
jgi:hypothetical protein